MLNRYHINTPFLLLTLNTFNIKPLRLKSYFFTCSLAITEKDPFRFMTVYNEIKT